MDDYSKHPMYGRFMSEVISGHYRNDRTSFEQFLESKRFTGNVNSLKDNFQNAAEKINEQLNIAPVFATWYTEGIPSDPVRLEKVVAVEKGDGWHLLGYDLQEKEYCIGGATVTSPVVFYEP